MYRSLILRTATLAVWALVTGCETSDSPISPAPTPVASVTVAAERASFEVGTSTMLTATAKSAAGVPLPDRPIAWTSSNSAIATVSNAGQVAALAAGTVRIRATSEAVSGDVELTILPRSSIDTAAYDLVFDRWMMDASGFVRPWLHRLDMRMPGAEPVSIFTIGNTWDGSASPDGTRIAFTCASDAGTGICVANRDGSGGVLLPGFGVLKGLRASTPAWSPDGTQIAFRGWPTGGDPGIFNPSDVWVMNADGTNKRRLTTGVRNQESYDSPTWSPRLVDGSYEIAFERTTRSTDGYMRGNLESVRLDGTGHRLITTPQAYMDAEPTWSPNGNTIAFVRTGGTVGGDIWLVSANGGNERPLMSSAVEPSGAQRSPAWSPDGGTIAFASNHEIILNYVDWQIYTVRADGTSLTRRTSDRPEKSNPAWIKR